MTTKSEAIKRLSAEGVAVAEIARRLGIRYQFAYGVLNRSNKAVPTVSKAGRVKALSTVKPPLSVAILLEAEFTRSAIWVRDDAGCLILNASLNRTPGVYAFGVDGRIMYVGLASMGLAKRIYFYGNPGVSQRTNIRIKALILNELSEGRTVEIWTACPPTSSWNGLPIDGCAGLELGLIRTFDLPWNIRSAC